MRQLYQKSGSTSRFSDFAIDVRKVVEADSLPEYTSVLHKNEEGDEIVHFVKRDHLDVNDPRYETPRHPRRRLARGITAKAIRLSEIVE
jgi:hypothetical protein